MAPDPTPDIAANPRVRLGAACELLRQIADPTSALALGWTVDGPNYVRGRCADFLAREELHRVADGIAPAVYDPNLRDLHRRTAAMSTPWPALATCGLWPTDCVTHPEHGAGSVVPSENATWPDDLERLCAGWIEVAFDTGCRWVQAAELTRTSEANPAF